MTAPAPDSSAPKHRRWRWILIAIIFLNGLGGVYLYLRDGPPPDDSDLMERDPIVPADQNGLVQLRKINAKLVDFSIFAESRGVDDETIQEIIAGQAGHETLVRDFLVQAQPEITKLQDILELPYFAFNDKISVSMVYPEISAERGLALALMMAAREAQHDGNYAQAAQNVLLLRRLVVRLMEIRGSLIQSLTTPDCNGAAAREIEDLLNDPALPAGDQALLAQAYADDALWNTAMSRSVAIEYQFEARMIDEFKQNKLGTYTPSRNKWEDAWMRLTLHESTTRAGFAGYDRMIRQQLGGPYSAIDFKAVTNPFSLGPPSGISALLAPNFGGRFLLATDETGWLKLIEYSYAQTAMDRLLRTGLALRHYYDDQHVLPAKLDDLVPQYLPGVPLDPFDEKPLRYNSAKGLVYSVGISLKDSGGSKYLGKTPASSPNDYREPIDDKEQPTLELKFQKPPAPAVPAPTPLPLGTGAK